MTVLIYVTALLMILASLTYAKLDLFRSFSGLQVSLSHYMETLERKPLQTLSKETYDRIHVKDQEGRESSSKAKGTARLSFNLFINKDKRAEQPDAYQQIRLVAKQLMFQLYSQQRFFKEISLKRPYFLDDLLNEIQEAIDRFPEGKKMTNAAEFSRLELHSPDLQFALYLMLEGLPISFKEPQPEATYNSADDPLLDNDDAADVKARTDEPTAKGGYSSLLDYITVNPQYQIRIFLAPTALLTAIFEDPDVVNQIRERRLELFRQLRRDATSGPLPKETQDLLTQQFRNEFALRGQATEFSAILDFTVTNTDPRKYDKDPSKNI